MPNDEYYQMMENKKYYNIHPLSIAKDANKNELNRLNQEYMLEYWVHIDDNQHVAQLGSKTSIEQQNEMYKLLYLMHDINDKEFSGNKMLKFGQFESLNYNGKYICDSMSNTQNSCINNELIQIMENKTPCHRYCSQINENELIKQFEFINQRPILSFDLTKLFDNNLFYNKQHNWMLMVSVRPKYLFVKHQQLQWIRLFDANNEDDEQKWY